MQKALITPSKPKAGATIAIPGSKSYTNRALILAALATGKTTLRNPLFSDDTKYTLEALRDLGVEVERKGDDLHIVGVGGKFKEPGKSLNLGNAGTGMRFLTAAMSITGFKTKLYGNSRMSQRPIKDLLKGLRDLGVKVESTNKTGCPPIKNQGNGVKGGRVEISGKISSQFISAIMMIAPFAEQDVEIVIVDELVSKPYIDMTIQVIKDFGVSVSNHEYERFVIKAGQKYKGCDYLVEGDTSSASYFFALEKLHDVKLDIKNIKKDSLQADIGFLDVEVGGEIDLNHMPDAAMTVAILAAFHKGKTRLTNIANLRVKETDRIKALVTELNKVGCDAHELEDGIEINGDPSKLHGNVVIETYDDHRMAMCFAVLASKIENVQILDPDCTSKTYPTFFEDLERAGFKVEKRKIPNIILTGMRGSGKSTIGKLIAKKLRYRFVDTDDKIEKQEKMSISDMVKKKSWFYFRKKEKYVVRSISNKKDVVIATGGGVILDKENVKSLKKLGKIVFLKYDLDVLEERLKKSHERPALTKHKSLKDELKEVWSKRKDKYLDTADMVYEDDKDLNKAERAEQIIYSI
ncbi:shikimate kinase [Patescibacteria group bacterium]